MTTTGETLFTAIYSFDGKEYICKICHLTVSKGKIPCQAVCNGMYVDEIPVELVAQVLIEHHFTLLKTGQQRKVKSAISCMSLLNVTTDMQYFTTPTCRGDIYFGAVRPEFVQ